MPSSSCVRVRVRVCRKTYIVYSVQYIFVLCEQFFSYLEALKVKEPSIFGIPEDETTNGLSKSNQ